jgi:hypothetical protein
MSNDRRSAHYQAPVEYPHPFADLAVSLCQTARRQVYVLSPQLDHEVFDSETLADCLSRLARGGRETQVRLLVADHRPLVQRGHRLLTLARRLPSAVQLRKLVEHPDWNGETCVVRDRDGVLFSSGEGDQHAFYEPDSPATTQRHLERFEDFWRLAQPDVEFRSLSL